MSPKKWFIVGWVALIASLLFTFISVIFIDILHVICCGVMIVAFLKTLMFYVRQFKQNYQGKASWKRISTDSDTALKLALAVFTWEGVFAAYVSLTAVMNTFYMLAAYYIYQTIADILMVLFLLSIVAKTVLIIKNHHQLGQRVFFNPKTYLIIGLFLFTFAIAYLFFVMFHWNANFSFPTDILRMIYAVYPYVTGAFFLLALVTAVIKAIRTSKCKANPI